MRMTFEKLLRDIHPELYAINLSPQSFYANDLIELKLKYRLSQKQMAYILDLSLSEYLTIEAISMETSPEEYKNFVEVIKSYLKFKGEIINIT